MAIILWATACVKFIADPIMGRIIASALDTEKVFMYSWYVSALVVLLVMLGAYFILRLTGSKKWVP